MPEAVANAAAGAPAAPRLEKLQQVSLPAPVLALEATPDGATLFAGCLDGAVYSIDATALRPELLGRHDSYASGLALSADGRTLISGGYDGRIRWHELATRRTVRDLKAHEFWSWDLQRSPDGALVASVTGQYQAGGYKYEPAPEQEPSVRVLDAHSGELRHSFSHVPSVQAVAFSPDGRHLAAGNLMGEIRVWELASGRMVSQWKTDDLTSWGVIKSHHFLGGVFALRFSPDGEHLYACGMGPMVDPMAGNGVQRWQQFTWRDGHKVDQTHDGESGQGLMEALVFHPAGRVFVMAGRLFQGSWNLALFDRATGKNLLALDLKHRITDLRFNADGSRLYVAKARGQEKPKEGKWPDSGLVEIHALTLPVPAPA